jgi:hypothetical protein
MPKGGMKRPAHVIKLVEALRDHLAQAGIPAEIDAEAIPDTKLHRIYVVSPKFKTIPFMDQQSLVWRITENALPFEKQLLISGIVTLSGEEASELGRAKDKKGLRRRKTA